MLFMHTSRSATCGDLPSDRRAAAMRLKERARETESSKKPRRRERILGLFAKGTIAGRPTAHTLCGESEEESIFNKR